MSAGLRADCDCRDGDNEIEWAPLVMARRAIAVGIAGTALPAVQPGFAND
jgi:hypothetical protein